MSTLHAIGNWLYWFFGIGGSGPHYGFWSGTGSDIGELTIVGAVIVGWKHVNCHDEHCWRIGMHKVEGTPYHACRKHHPVLSKQPHITAEIMAKAHEEFQAQRRADSTRILEIHQQVTGPADASVPSGATGVPPN
ncbi:MAG: hypothetical protein ABSA31_03690 [Acidimicrobiales bacterium]|jgi:hypothetical protein